MSTVRLKLSEANADLERLDDLSRSLMNELRHREIAVESQVTQVPSGAKSNTAITVGALMVAVANSPAVANLVTGILDWLRRGRERSVKLSYGDVSIELSSASKEEQRRLTQWLEERIHKDKH